MAEKVQRITDQRMAGESSGPTSGPGASWREVAESKTRPVLAREELSSTPAPPPTS